MGFCEVRLHQGGLWGLLQFASFFFLVCLLESYVCHASFLCNLFGLASGTEEAKCKIGVFAALLHYRSCRYRWWVVL